MVGRASPPKEHAAPTKSKTLYTTTCGSGAGGGCKRRGRGVRGDIMEARGREDAGRCRGELQTPAVVVPNGPKDGAPLADQLADGAFPWERRLGRRHRTTCRRIGECAKGGASSLVLFRPPFSAVRFGGRGGVASPHPGRAGSTARSSRSLFPVSLVPRLAGDGEGALDWEEGTSPTPAQWSRATAGGGHRRARVRGMPMKERHLTQGTRDVGGAAASSSREVISSVDRGG